MAGNGAYIGAGIGQGLQQATNTLLQVQMYKQQKAQQDAQDKIKNRYEDSRAKYEDMMVDNMAKSSDAYIKQVQGQAVQDYLAKNGGQGGDNSGGNQAGVNPVGFMSSGGAPASAIPQTYQIPDGRGHFITKVIPGQNANVTSQQDIQLAVKGVAEGKIPPEKIASYRDVTRVNAELERQGINYSDLELEWQATKKAVQTMNGPQQIRLRQAINFGLKSVDDIVKMSDQLARGPNPILNRAQMNAAKQGLLGPDMQQKATLLDQQIADTVSDLGQVYMGGNSPTDHGLELAGTNLKGEWSAPQLKAAAQNIKKLLSFRLNAINNTMAEVPGGDAKQTYGKGAVQDDTQGNAPAVGTVDSGYKFKGGDPADQNNWEKVSA